MNIALVIALGAVAISLLVVFIALRGARAKKDKNGDSGSSYTASDTSSSDCSVSDGGGCDGGGGGGGD
ncbi:MAG TPA: hypothetical protein VGN36_08170 [Sphingorhabdus sp.]|jgi:uncharacterized membrane protein YgcG|nr:hypothetical protein [Sphingorhabdus sp.]